MAFIKSWSSSSSSLAGALLLASLLLSAAASALAQTAPPELDDEGCPVNIIEIIRAALSLEPLPEGAQEAIDQLGTADLGECICNNFIAATDIDTTGDLNLENFNAIFDEAIQRLGGSPFSTPECNPRFPPPPPAP